MYFKPLSFHSCKKSLLKRLNVMHFNLDKILNLTILWYKQFILINFFSDDDIAGEIIKTKPGVFIYKPLPLKILVKSVSCGKEHVLLLSKIGVVLTFGGGRQVILPGFVQVLKVLQST